MITIIHIARPTVCGTEAEQFFPRPQRHTLYDRIERSCSILHQNKGATSTKTSFEDARCKCVCPKFQKDANSTVVVIIIICVTSLLLIYMLFLLCLDPLIAHRPTAYQQHMDEVVNLDDQSVTQVPQFESAGTRPRLGRQKSVMNYVSDEQRRWKSTVQEQRKNIYDKHTMLN
ncbi:Y1161-like protein [Mya arenaria]|uniref:Y1161-like protein n=1 Tax=Mya arenaria TaxID=6604 RepID=A0ABY7EE65_MYAAR|nr:Y1161-like protein [Mya arenaria]